MRVQKVNVCSFLHQAETLDGYNQDYTTAEYQMNQIMNTMCPSVDCLYYLLDCDDIVFVYLPSEVDKLIMCESCPVCEKEEASKGRK